MHSDDKAAYAATGRLGPGEGRQRQGECPAPAVQTQPWASSLPGWPQRWDHTSLALCRNRRQRKSTLSAALQVSAFSPFIICRGAPNNYPLSWLWYREAIQERWLCFFLSRDNVQKHRAINKAPFWFAGLHNLLLTTCKPRATGSQLHGVLLITKNTSTRR